MAPKYFYLWLDLLSFAVPFSFSFHPRASFAKKWKYVLPAIALSAALFIAWDALYTHLAVWGFNDRYLTGVGLFGLPIEEVLFFFCIPYACLFTYFSLNHLIEKDYLFPHQELISSLIIVVLLVAGGYFMHQLYTGVTFLVTGLVLTFVWLKLRMRFLGRFYFAFAILLIPFLIINGILTGAFIEEPVVWYNNEENLGIRLGTIPVEDIVYALLLLLIPITLWEKLEEWQYW